MTAQLSHGEALHSYVNAFFDEMVDAGVRHICACPGSRSTPLAMIAAEREDIRLWMHLDERSSSFFALGIAKQTGLPVAIITTSGTAAANLMPAVVEARYGRVPLIVLTADRPPELQEIGAPQTIDQQYLFGRHAKWCTSLMLPDATPDALRYVRATSARAVASAQAVPSGPVHVNIPFREPLIPVAPLSPSDGSNPIVRPTERPKVLVTHGHRAPDAPALQRLAADLIEIDQGLIICGPFENAEFADEVAALAAVLNYPILADPLSGIRSGVHDLTNIVDSFDALLRDPSFVDRFAPRAILRFGALPTSKPVFQYLQRHEDCRQIVIDGAAGWNEPTGLARDFIHADEAAFCVALTDALMNIQARNLDANPRIRWASVSAGDPETKQSVDWASTWRKANRIARRVINTTATSFDEPFEGQAIADLCDHLIPGATLVAGSSMPVRDLDTFVGSTERPIRYLSNRGANGIDGVVSTALGVAASSNEPVVLAIGDVSFYHDLNGLLAARQYPIDLTILLLNNDGGGIFSFLPQAANPTNFELLFGTPHGLSFGPVVEMYGGRFQSPGDRSSLRAALREAIETPGLDVIEIRTERRRNVELHRQVWPAVSTALRDAGITLPMEQSVSTR